MNSVFISAKRYQPVVPSTHLARHFLSRWNWAPSHGLHPLSHSRDAHHPGPGATCCRFTVPYTLEGRTCWDARHGTQVKRLSREAWLLPAEGSRRTRARGSGAAMSTGPGPSSFLPLPHLAGPRGAARKSSEEAVEREEETGRRKSTNYDCRRPFPLLTGHHSSVNSKLQHFK